ncbi:hypothetical protein ACFRFL_22805 [Streptomyces sp. NPDC056708]|uniref:hypothetical protein n=1 Tax=unclassified Streptomyces TaxID=2593676 RepID=UPI0036BD4DAE
MSPAARARRTSRTERGVEGSHGEGRTGRTLAADRCLRRRRVCRGGRGETPFQGIRNIAGPDVFPLDELGRITPAARPDGRRVVTDDRARMSAMVTGDALTAPADADRPHALHGPASAAVAGLLRRSPTPP